MLFYTCRCSEPLQDGRPPLVVDAGANIGCVCMLSPFQFDFSNSCFTSYFSLLAMSLGCRVLAFEPQMRLLPAFKRSLYFNNFDANKRLALIPCALSHNRDVLTSKDHHNWGEWSLRRAETDDNVSVPSSPSELGADTHTHNVSTIHATTLDSLVQEDVLVRTTGSP